MKKTYYLNRNQDDEQIVILNSESFETKNLCDCYDRNGQTIGCYNAGCYTLDNSSTEIKHDLESYIETKFQLESDFDYEDFLDQTENEIDTDTELYNSIKKEIELFLTENESHTNVEAFNYWDGSNYKSLFLNSDDISTNCIEEMGEDESNKIIAAFNRANLQDIGFGKSEFVGRKYKFTSTQFASDPFITTVEILC